MWNYPCVMQALPKDVVSVPRPVRVERTPPPESATPSGRCPAGSGSNGLRLGGGESHGQRSPDGFAAPWADRTARERRWSLIAQPDRPRLALHKASYVGVKPPVHEESRSCPREPPPRLRPFAGSGGPAEQSTDGRLSLAARSVGGHASRRRSQPGSLPESSGEHRRGGPEQHDGAECRRTWLHPDL